MVVSNYLHHMNGYVVASTIIITWSLSKFQDTNRYMFSDIDTKMDHQSILQQKIYSIKSRMEARDEVVNLELKEETVTQLKKLLGIQSEDSPTSITRGPLSITHELDVHKQLLDTLVTHFVNEVLRFALMHINFFGSLQFCNVDVKFAIEHFVSSQKRYINIESEGNEDHHMNMENDDEDEEWIPDDDNDEDLEGSDDSLVDDDNNYDDEDSEDDMYNEDENGNFPNWPRRPSEYPTPSFDMIYPSLSEGDDYFKFTSRDLHVLAAEVMHARFRSDIVFEENSADIFKDAMMRYLVAECRI